jgi:hypothetical protein
MRTLIYDAPADDATHLEGVIESEAITQETPVPFRVPIIRADGVIDIEATVALVHEMEDRIDEDIAAGLVVGRIPVNP